MKQYFFIFLLIFNLNFSSNSTFNNDNNRTSDISEDTKKFLIQAFGLSEEDFIKRVPGERRNALKLYNIRNSSINSDSSKIGADGKYMDPYEYIYKKTKESEEQKQINKQYKMNQQIDIKEQEKQNQINQQFYIDEIEENKKYDDKQLNINKINIGDPNPSSFFLDFFIKNNYSDSVISSKKNSNNQNIDQSSFNSSQYSILSLSNSYNRGTIIVKKEDPNLFEKQLKARNIFSLPQSLSNIKTNQNFIFIPPNIQNIINKNSQEKLNLKNLQQEDLENSVVLSYNDQNDENKPLTKEELNNFLNDLGPLKKSYEFDNNNLLQQSNFNNNNESSENSNEFPKSRPTIFEIKKK
jgi:hypothetical protein